MKIQCNACEAAEAKVLCCADEAVLCVECDQKVHAANKLAGKHQRVPLLSASSTRLAKCDICQESFGYFFCLEDRAILCRNCDVAVHSVNSWVSKHQRFLITGVQVGLKSTGSVPSISKKQSSFPKVLPEPSLPSVKKLKSSPSPLSDSIEMNEDFSNVEFVKDRSMGPLKAFLPMSENLTEWPLEEFFRFSDFNQSYGFADIDSSKADNGKLGSSEGSTPTRSFDEDMEAVECSGQVPEIRSPSAASGLHSPSNSQYRASHNAAFVPDFPDFEDPTVLQGRRALLKRRLSFHS